MHGASAAAASCEDPKIEDRLVNDHSYHAPGERKIVMHQDVRLAALNFARLINRNVPAGREKALALTKIEEAVFWANAGIARNPLPTA